MAESSDYSEAAIKQPPFVKEVDAEFFEEINNLQALAILQGHPCIMPLRNIEAAQKPKIWLRVDVGVRGITLREYIERCQPLSTEELKFIFYQILQGLAHCHSHQLVHGALNDEAVELNSLGQVHLTNFDHSKQFGQQIQPQPNVFSAPEFHLTTQPSEDEMQGGIDMWAVGVLLVKSCVGLIPWEHAFAVSPIHAFILQTRYVGTASLTGEQHRFLQSLKEAPPVYIHPPQLDQLIPDVDASCKDLLLQLLCFDPKHRVSVFEALRHPWFDAVHASSIS